MISRRRFQAAAARKPRAPKEGNKAGGACSVLNIYFPGRCGAAHSDVLMHCALASLALIACVARAADSACDRAAAATGGLIAWNATAKRCDPDVCVGSPEDILDFFTAPAATKATSYLESRGSTYCDHVQAPNAYATWRPGAIPSCLACR